MSKLEQAVRSSGMHREIVYYSRRNRARLVLAYELYEPADSKQPALNPLLRFFSFDRHESDCSGDLILGNQGVDRIQFLRRRIFSSLALGGPKNPRDIWRVHGRVGNIGSMRVDNRPPLREHLASHDYPPHRNAPTHRGHLLSIRGSILWWNSIDRRVSRRKVMSGLQKAKNGPRGCVLHRSTVLSES
mgnify:CR=1 FL=1